MSKKPWMPWYIADFVVDTVHLTAAETGAYMLLIGHYWLQGGLPNDDRALAKIARMTSAEWRKARAVLAPFFEKDWSGQKRLDAELAKAADISTKRAASAKQRHSKRSAIAEQKDTQSQSQSHPQEDTAGAGARARELALPHWPAWKRIAGAMNADIEDPRWFSQHHRVAVWLTKGWDLEADILPTVKRLVEAKDGRPIVTLRYFEHAIADAYASRTRPLPEGTPERNRHGTGGSVHEASRELLKQFREFDRPPPRDDERGDEPGDAELCDGTGHPHVRLLAKG